MNHNKIKFAYLLALISSILTISCSDDNFNNEDTIDASINSDGLYVENNIIHFTSMADFKATIDYLMSIDADRLGEWEETIGFNNSMRKYYENWVNSEPETIDDRWSIISDPVFASIVNSQGIYSVGDTIHIITYDMEYLITDGDYSKLNMLSDLDILKSTDKSILVYPIERKYSEYDLKWAGWKSIEKEVGIWDRRAQLKAWNDTYVGYASCGMRIVGRQQFKNIWGKWKWKDWYMDWAKVEGTARMNYWITGSTSGVFEYTGSAEGSNTKDVSKTLGYAVGIGAVINCYWIHGTYYYNESNVSLNWYIEWN